MIVIDVEHKIKDIVYLKTDPEQSRRIVTGYLVRECGVTYILACGTNESYHYDYEMSAEVDVLVTSTN